MIGKSEINFLPFPILTVIKLFAATYNLNLPNMHHITATKAKIICRIRLLTPTKAINFMKIIAMSKGKIQYPKTATACNNDIFPPNILVLNATTKAPINTVKRISIKISASNLL